MNEPADHSAVPGVRLSHPRSDTVAGDVRDGQLEPGGEPVTVRLIELPHDAALRARAAVDGERLVALRHPHVLPVLRVEPTPTGLAVIMQSAGAATTLAQILRERRRLAAGEVVTLGIPLAQALAAVHTAGLTHGRVSAADVLVDTAGRPILVGAGVCGLLGAGGAAADDVRDLGRLLVGALGEAVDDGATAVALAVGPALIDEPELRPAADEVGVALARTTPPVPPVPIRARPGPVPVVRRPPPVTARRRIAAAVPLRALVAVTVVLLLAGAAGFAGWRSVQVRDGEVGAEPVMRTAQTGPAPAARASAPVVGAPSAAARSLPPAPPSGFPPSGTPTAGPQTSGSTGPRSTVPSRSAAPKARSADGWRRTLAGLDEIRARSFEQGSREALLQVDAPGSAALTGDLALLTSLASRGAHVSGLRPQSTDVQVRSEGSDLVVLVTTDVLAAYRFVDAGGRDLGGRPGTLRRHEVTLVRTPAGWRIALVRQVTP